MAATITLRLNDQASGGLKSLQQVLEETGQVSSRVAADMAVLTDEERQQIAAHLESVQAVKRLAQQM
jgi:hypothetical protein